MIITLTAGNAGDGSHSSENHQGMVVSLVCLPWWLITFHMKKIKKVFYGSLTIVWLYLSTTRSGFLSSKELFPLKIFILCDQTNF